MKTARQPKQNSCRVYMATWYTNTDWVTERQGLPSGLWPQALKTVFFIFFNAVTLSFLTGAWSRGMHNQVRGQRRLERCWGWKISCVETGFNSYFCKPEHFISFNPPRIESLWYIVLLRQVYYCVPNKTPRSRIQNKSHRLSQNTECGTITSRWQGCNLHLLVSPSHLLTKSYARTWMQHAACSGFHSRCVTWLVLHCKKKKAANL